MVRHCARSHALSVRGQPQCHGIGQGALSRGVRCQAVDWKRVDSVALQGDFVCHVAILNVQSFSFIAI